MEIFKKTFMGFRRIDGSVGIRNYVLVMSTTACLNQLIGDISAGLKGIIGIRHNRSCSTLGSDQKQIANVLYGFGLNPNVGAVIVIELGCEAISPAVIAQEIEKSGKPVTVLRFEKFNDINKLSREARRLAMQLHNDLMKQIRIELPLENLCIGVKCCGSDATSIIASNKVIGNVVDLIVSNRGTVIFSEVTELIGAEGILTTRAKNKNVAENICDIILERENVIKKMGVDLRGVEPDPANIKGGLTTVEEKALGSVIKAGSCLIEGVLKYGEKSKKSGLYLMNGPDRTAEVFAGMAASGVILVLVAMGGGIPRHLRALPACSGKPPFFPVIKVTGNPDSYNIVKDNFDFYAGKLFENSGCMENLTEKLLNKTLCVCSGIEATILDKVLYDELVSIYITGQVV